ncbi:MAG: TIGR03905 family TSCPD domain-containing protein [Clostridia bacterium]|jgi:uncharacterized protein (TIGR03905 family)|nr:TIGR03905 family TSCPD domain-containing protein [Clostridia bacterium]
MFTYQTQGTCSRQIIFEVDEENKLHSVRFIGGCSGNLQGVSRLVEGKDIDEVQNLLQGVKCRNNTSCPDQLARAIAAYKKSKENG